MAETISSADDAAILRLSKGYIPANAIYPPEVVSMSQVDHVYEANGTYFSRDIGRSSVIGGKVFYQFGDTFCHDNEDNSVLISNTVAVVEDTEDPFRTHYPFYSSNGVVKPFLELNGEEQAHEEETAEQEYRARITLWQFGGIVETTPGKGLLWYEKRVLYWDKSEEEGKHCGIGLADVRVDVDGNIRASRREGLLFGKDEPLIGNVAAILDGTFVYLMGNRGKEDIILARVPKDEASERNAYRYWNGESYGKDWTRAVAVLHGYQSACFFRSDMFGTDLPWVMVGVNKFCDNMVQIGATKQLEGPWTTQAVCKAPILNEDKFSEGCICYCVYAHPWASAGDKSSLFITWSEQYPGEVVGAKLTFKMEPEAWWERFWLLQDTTAACDKTNVDLTADEDFVRLQAEGNITITEGTMSFIHGHLASDSPYHAKYMEFKGSDETKVAQAIRIYHEQLNQNCEALKEIGNQTNFGSIDDTAALPRSVDDGAGAKS